jgi:thiamine-monophosphate kinase
MAEPGLEAALLARLKQLATHPAARGLADDAAVLGWPLGQELVATHDMLAEGVHFTPHCPPADIGWKLVAVNLSDLAAMGARPVGVLMGAGIGAGRDPGWAAALVEGIAQALARFEVPLLGGDTIRTPGGTILALTALGQVPPGLALGRAGAAAGDELWVSGTVGDAGLGLRVAQGEAVGAHYALLLRRYRRPVPRLALGLALRGVASAALDVSDGLLIDAARLAEASGLAAQLRSADVPISVEALDSGVPVEALATSGDDYELLFAAPPEAREAVQTAAARARTPVACIGSLVVGQGLTLDGAVPARLGYQHR